MRKKTGFQVLVHPVAPTLLAAAVLASGCHYRAMTNVLEGSGTIVDKEHEVQPFEILHAGTILRLNIHAGEKPSVVVHADDNLIDHIEVTQEGKRLTVMLEKDLRVRRASITVDVTTPTLNELFVEGAAQVKLEDLQAKSLAIRLAGAAKLSGQVDAEKLEITASGAARIELETPDDRTAESVAINAKGATSVDLERFPAKRVSVEMSGAGHCRVFASEELNAEAAGVGSITYFGNPEQVTKKVRGTAKISKGSSKTKE